MGAFLLGLLPDFAAKFLARFLKDWRRDQSLKDLGAAQNANAAHAEADRVGNEGDDIDQRIEGASDADLDAAMRDTKK